MVQEHLELKLLVQCIVLVLVMVDIMEDLRQVVVSDHIQVHLEGFIFVTMEKLKGD